MPTFEEASGFDDRIHLIARMMRIAAMTALLVFVDLLVSPATPAGGTGSAGGGGGGDPIFGIETRSLLLLLGTILELVNDMGALVGLGLTSVRSPFSSTWGRTKLPPSAFWTWIVGFEIVCSGMLVGGGLLYASY